MAWLLPNKSPLVSLLIDPNVWSLPVFPWAFVLHSPLKINIMSSARRKLLPSPLAGSQYCVSSIIRGRRLSFGQPLHLIQYMKRGGWVYLRANSGLGYPGSSLPSRLSLSPTNLLIGRIFPVCIHGVGVT